MVVDKCIEGVRWEYNWEDERWTRTTRNCTPIEFIKKYKVEE
jgi:hypothetical protein